MHSLYLFFGFPGYFSLCVREIFNEGERKKLKKRNRGGFQPNGSMKERKKSREIKCKKEKRGGENIEIKKRDIEITAVKNLWLKMENIFFFFNHLLVLDVV